MKHYALETTVGTLFALFLLTAAYYTMYGPALGQNIQYVVITGQIDRDTSKDCEKCHDVYDSAKKLEEEVESLQNELREQKERQDQLLERFQSTVRSDPESTSSEFMLVELNALGRKIYTELPEAIKHIKEILQDKEREYAACECSKAKEQLPPRLSDYFDEEVRQQYVPSEVCGNNKKEGSEECDMYDAKDCKKASPHCGQLCTCECIQDRIEVPDCPPTAKREWNEQQCTYECKPCQGCKAKRIAAEQKQDEINPTIWRVCVTERQAQNIEPLDMQGSECREGQPAVKNVIEDYQRLNEEWSACQSACDCRECDF